MIAECAVVLIFKRQICIGSTWSKISISSFGKHVHCTWRHLPTLAIFKVNIRLRPVLWSATCKRVCWLSLRLQSSEIIQFSAIFKWFNISPAVLCDAGLQTALKLGLQVGLRLHLLRTTAVRKFAAMGPTGITGCILLFAGKLTLSPKCAARSFSDKTIFAKMSPTSLCKKWRSWYCRSLHRPNPSNLKSNIQLLRHR
jgi:hypothetical protein